MKNIISFLFAGIIGGLIVVASFSMINKDQVIYELNQSPKAILTSSSTATAPNDFVLAAERVTPSVVSINVREDRLLAQKRLQEERNKRGSDWFDFHKFFNSQPYPKNGNGSGVIISEDGYIVTNNHVIEDGDIIDVMIGDRTLSASVIGKDPSTDIALIKVDATGLTPVEFANSDRLKVGEWVVAIGSPFSYLTSTVTAGIVSAKARDIDILQNDFAIEEFIQTDAAINPGNSGGALVNTEGNLVGINTAIATPTGVYAGYSFAIPSNLVKKIVDDIKENGDIERARLGIRGRTIDEIIKKENNLTINQGFIVDIVDKSSGAQFSGVLPGDVIIQANEKRVDKFEDLYEVVEFAKVGETINLVVLRKNKKLKIPVYLRKGI